MVPYHDCVLGFNSYTINYGFRRRPTLKEASELLLYKHSTLFFSCFIPPNYISQSIKVVYCCEELLKKYIHWSNLYKD